MLSKRLHLSLVFHRVITAFRRHFTVRLPETYWLKGFAHAIFVS